MEIAVPHNSQAPHSNAYAYPLLIKQLWHAPLVASPEQEIVHKGRRQTYRETRARVGQLANVLSKLGVVKGDVVAVMDWDSHRYLECYFAIPMMGAVLMTVNIRLSPEQIQYTVDHCSAKVILLHQDFKPVLDELLPMLGSVQHVIGLSDDSTLPPEACRIAGEYEFLLSQASSDYDFEDFDENTRATTFYTTGTTGLPKGVYFSHRQLVLHTLAGMAAICSPAENQRLHRGDVYMPITPMFHVHAWGMPYIALALGVKHIYPGRYIPEELLKLISLERVTFSHCVPTLLQMLLASPASAGVDLSQWKVVIGGSALSAGLVEAARSKGIDIFGGYGMSETCPLLTISQLTPELDRLDAAQQVAWRCKAGTPVPLVDLRCVDEKMIDVPADGVSTGEVVARAPWLTQGYAHRPEATAELWQGGYLHTQDIGYFEKGYLKVTDRLKDVIKTGGEWVSSLHVEDLLSHHSAVGDCAVIGVKDEKWGERPIALIVLRAGKTASSDEIKLHLQHYVGAGSISKYAIPERIYFVESIAKTSVGKHNKKLLREQYL